MVETRNSQGASTTNHGASEFLSTRFNIIRMLFYAGAGLKACYTGKQISDIIILRASRMKEKRKAHSNLLEFQNKIG
jgi:hypothetical protein